MKAFAAAAAWFLFAAIFVFVSVPVLFWLGAFSRVSIVFYRGLIVILASTVLCCMMLLLARRRWPSWHVRDAVSACAFAFGLNVCFLVVVPVTIDRSISMFMLTQMAGDPRRSFTASDLRTSFVTTYVDGYGQIERRLDEQVMTGNVAAVPNGFRLTAQGRAFVQAATILSRVFGTDQRFVTPVPIAP